jgi:hypothetical protein
VVAQAARTAGERVEQREAGVLRRTRIRRTRDEVGAVPAQLAAQVRVMAGLPRIEPAFGEHCAVCEFSAPCLAILVGEDPEPLLANGFQLRPVDAKPKPKLGQSTWGFGRGAAPPEW